MTVFIDRSNVNGADNYAAAPVTHLYLKVSEGTTFVDSTYQQRRQQGRSAGAKVGGYHFAGHNNAASEADFFLSKIGDVKPGDLRPCLDLESGQSKEWAEEFVKQVKDRLGYWPVLYGSTSFIQPMRNASRTLRRCPWWRAEFSVNDGNHHELQGGTLGAAAHQYTSNASVQGIAGRTDRSVLIDEAAMLVPSARRPRPYAVYKDGDHKRNYRRYRLGAIPWALRNRPKQPGHTIQIRHRKEP